VAIKEQMKSWSKKKRTNEKQSCGYEAKKSPQQEGK
jgi:hypothetical protein